MRNSQDKLESVVPPPIWFDYAHQAWVRDGLYIRCGHPATMDCNCYNRQHEGELADPKFFKVN